MALLTHSLSTIAVLDGSYLLKMTSPDFAVQLVDFLPTYPQCRHDLNLPPIDLTFFVDSHSHPQVVSKSKMKGNFHMVTKPWHGRKREWAHHWEDVRRRVHSQSGRMVGVSGGGQVKVLMQQGVDATIAALLVELGMSYHVKTIVLCSGDQDFAPVVKSVAQEFRKQIVLVSTEYRSSRDLREQAHSLVNLWDLSRVSSRRGMPW